MSPNATNARDEVNLDPRSDKYQSTRYSQLSTFGLIVQIREMYEDRGR